MPFDLDNLNPGTWFPFPDDEEESLCLRALTNADLNLIAKKTVKKDKFWKNDKLYTDYVQDEEKANNMMVGLTIVDWKLKDKDGKAIPCTEELKIKLANNSVRFAKHYSKSLNKLSAAISEEEEKLEKN